MIHVIRPAHSDQIQFIAGLSLFSNFAKVQTSQTSHQSYQMKLTKLYKALFSLHSLQLIAIFPLNSSPPAPLTAAPSHQLTGKYVNNKFLQMRNLCSLFLTATPLTSPLTTSSTVPHQLQFCSIANSSIAEVF
jgi:hypothetical protein